MVDKVAGIEKQLGHLRSGAVHAENVAASMRESPGFSELPVALAQLLPAYDFSQRPLFMTGRKRKAHMRRRSFSLLVILLAAGVLGLCGCANQEPDYDQAYAPYDYYGPDYAFYGGYAAGPWYRWDHDDWYWDHHSHAWRFDRDRAHGHDFNWHENHDAWAGHSGFVHNAGPRGPSGFHPGGSSFAGPGGGGGHGGGGHGAHH